MKQRKSKKVGVGVVLVLAILLAVVHVPFHRSEARESTTPPVTSKSDELKVLDRFIGTWNVKGMNKRTEWNPEEQHFTGRGQFQWELKGQALSCQARFQFPGQTEDYDFMILRTFDKEKKVFRNWYFDSIGAFPRSDTTGQWNPNSQTLTWITNLGEGRTQTGIERFLDKDTIQWSSVTKDKKGIIFQDTQGTSTRYKEKK